MFKSTKTVRNRKTYLQAFLNNNSVKEFGRTNFHPSLTFVSLATLLSSYSLRNIQQRFHEIFYAHNQILANVFLISNFEFFTDSFT